MRGTDKISGSLFSYVDIEDRIPARHPLRQVKRIVDEALASLDAEADKPTEQQIVLHLLHQLPLGAH